MEQIKKEILKMSRPESRPVIPRKVRLRAKFFGKQKLSEYLWDYYERESEHRVPFYLPYIYRKECFDYLRRYGQIPKKQVTLILIDGGDYRSDLLLSEFLEELNYLTIVTERKEYFENLQERAFMELGLLIDLFYPWEEKNLQGNLVWDLTQTMQSADCYPKKSICFVPHKKEWKILQLRRECETITTVYLKGVETGKCQLIPEMAESLLTPAEISFRKSRCEELEKWCKKWKWSLKLKAQNPEKP